MSAGFGDPALRVYSQRKGFGDYVPHIVLKIYFNFYYLVKFQFVNYVNIFPQKVERFNNSF